MAWKNTKVILKNGNSYEMETSRYDLIEAIAKAGDGSDKKNDFYHGEKFSFLLSEVSSIEDKDVPGGSIDKPSWL